MEENFIPYTNFCLGFPCTAEVKKDCKKDKKLAMKAYEKRKEKWFKYLLKYQKTRLK